MRIARVCLGLVCSALALCGPRSVWAAEREPILEHVFMVSRHGVRSPIRPLATLEALTQRSWPKWPVGPGEMTAHGARSLSQMADFLRDTYRHKGVLAQGCPAQDALEVYSDAADLRTRLSGEVFADHLAPGCGIRPRHASGPALDPLFNASETKACPSNPPAMTSSARPKATDISPEDRRALKALQDILAPKACQPSGDGVCLMPGVEASDTTVASKLAVAATLAEGLYLEYAQGFPKNEVGWGKAGSESTITAVMPAYERGINFMRRNPLISARRGAVLIETILRLLQGRALPAEGPPLSSDAKLVMIAGHDSNLLQAAVLMGLDWRLPDQPSVTAPGTTLAFEVWRDPATDRRTLKVVVYAQTLRQIREGTTLDRAHPPDVVPVAPETCTKTSADDCELATFVANVERRLASLCKG